jgi:hypothetical protein
MTRIFAIWRDSLHTVLDYYERQRGSLVTFFPLLFLFFVLLNVACYWLAIYTAFPIYMQTAERAHYLKLQFPVGFLGALFDSLSFFITIWIIRRALAAKSSMEYMMHLSLDLVIAVVATSGYSSCSPPAAGLSVSTRMCPRNLPGAAKNIPCVPFRRCRTRPGSKTPRTSTSASSWGYRRPSPPACTSFYLFALALAPSAGDTFLLKT